MPTLAVNTKTKSRGFLIWEWVLALALLGSFALFAIALLQRQESYVLQQQQLQRDDLVDAAQRHRTAIIAGHRLLFDLQEGATW